MRREVGDVVNNLCLVSVLRSYSAYIRSILFIGGKLSTHHVFYLHSFVFPCHYCFYNRFSFINYLIPSSSIFRRCGSNIIRRDIEYIDYVNKTNKNRHAYIRISSLRSGYVRGHAIQNPSKTDIKIRTCDYTYMSRSPGRVSTS